MSSLWQIKLHMLNLTGNCVELEWHLVDSYWLNLDVKPLARLHLLLKVHVLSGKCQHTEIILCLKVLECMPV